jgi:hypothetical protein
MTASTAATALTINDVQQRPDAVVPFLAERSWATEDNRAALSARDCVALLYQASGASAIMRNVPIQRYHRDIQAISQHAFLFAPTVLETYGRTLLGLEPNSVFI